MSDSRGGQANPGTAPSSSGVDFSKTIFLVANDKAFFRDMLQTALKQAGAADIKHATTIETAIQLLNRFGQRIGCVICDWDMAPMGGLELLRLIRCRSLPKIAPRLPVVVLTARADAGAIKAAMALDVNGVAVAPLSFEKLIKIVTSAMARNWTLQAASHYGAVPAVAPPAAGVAIKDAAKGRDAGASLGHAKPLPRRANEAGNVSIKKVHMCVLADVTPGAILARDIHDQSGHLLLKSGTELKSALIDRLKAVAPGAEQTYHLWVGDYGE